MKGKHQVGPEKVKAPTPFAPNPGIAFDQQLAAAEGVARTAFMGSQAALVKPTHYKKKPHFPTAKPVAQ